ncbi:MAG: VPLPA-CTERM sorting domain-containing protein [Desulfobulbus sp.]|jgi:hypothetical protein
MKRKLFYAVSLLAGFQLGISATAHAWYMELTNIKGDITKDQYYTQFIRFYSESGTNMLNDFFLTVDYDETKVKLRGIVFYDYYNDDPEFPEKLWMGGDLPWTDTGELVYNIMGSETFGYIDQYFPPAGTTDYVKLVWTPLVTESDVTVAVFADSDRSDFITVDKAHYWMPEDPVNKLGDPLLSVILDENNNRHILTPVPVPAAAWLLGAGLMGLAGLHRRKSA